MEVWFLTGSPSKHPASAVGGPARTRCGTNDPDAASALGSPWYVHLTLDQTWHRQQQTCLASCPVSSCSFLSVPQPDPWCYRGGSQCSSVPYLQLKVRFWRNFWFCVILPQFLGYNTNSCICTMQQFSQCWMLEHSSYHNRLQLVHLLY